MRPVRFVWVALLASISVSVGFAQGSGDGKTFKITYQVSAKMPDGTLRYFGTRIRYGNRDGRFREVSFDPAGNEIGFRLNAFDGQFIGRPSEQKLSSLGSFQNPGFPLEKNLGKKASKKSNVLGYTVYKRKSSDGSAKIYSAREFVGAPLKVIARNRKTLVATTQEAIAVAWEAVSEDLFAKPNWPTSPEQSGKGDAQTLVYPDLDQPQLEKQKSQ